MIQYLPRNLNELINVVSLYRECYFFMDEISSNGLKSIDVKFIFNVFITF